MRRGSTSIHASTRILRLQNTNVVWLRLCLMCCVGQWRLWNIRINLLWCVSSKSCLGDIRFKSFVFLIDLGQIIIFALVFFFLYVGINAVNRRSEERFALVLDLHVSCFDTVQNVNTRQGPLSQGLSDAWANQKDLQAFKRFHTGRNHCQAQP